MLADGALEKMIRKILDSPKYRGLGIPPESVQDLLERELKVQNDPKQAEKKAREKLHQIIAPYLGDPDYPTAESALTEAADAGEQAVRDWCTAQLQSHASTRERLPMMAEFYGRIFEQIGQPESILDLACAIHPLAFPWMGLPRTTHYHAYDLHSPRIRLINQFFTAWGLEPLAEVQDILLSVPAVQADAAFFFKEAHRFENRRKGSCRDFFGQLQVRWIVVTLPAENLTARHQMRDRQRQLIQKAVEGRDWKIQEDEVGSEMIFFIDKHG